MLERSSTPKRTLDQSSHAFLLKTLQQICRLLIFSDSLLRRRMQHQICRLLIFSDSLLRRRMQHRLKSSLAWLLAQKPFLVPIPGTRSADHLHDNLRAVDVQLTPADLGEIETALSTGPHKEALKRPERKPR